MSLPPVLSSAVWLPDPAFSADGWAVTQLPVGSNFGPSVLQADGKIAMSGSFYPSFATYYDFAVLRYNGDGSPDTGFGVGGLVATTITNSLDTAWAITLQPDNHIVVAGSAYVTPDTYLDFALARYDSDGNLDASFGGDGVVTVSLTPSRDEAFAVMTTSDGKIVAAGSSYVSDTFYDFALARFNADGSLDPSFGQGGAVLTAFGSGADEAYAIAAQPDGKIVAAGSSQVVWSDFALARYNADGSLDPTFGVGGLVTTDFSGANDVARSLAVQPDGKILVGGSAMVAGTYGLALARYNSDGTLDASFGGDGRVTVESVSGVWPYAAVPGADSLALLPDGKFLVAAANGSNIILLRYNADGSLDPSLHGGLAVANGNTALEPESAHLLAQPDGAFLVTAGTLDGAAVVRFVAGGGLPDDSATQGSLWAVSIPRDLFNDPDGGEVSYNIGLQGGAPLPGWLSFDTEHFLLSGTPAFNDVGTLAIQITAVDQEALSSSDVFLLDVTPLPIVGSAAADAIAGSPGNDTIRGLEGDDSIAGIDGSDFVGGNTGNDTLAGGNGNDELRGGQNDDLLIGAAGADTLVGGFGNDLLRGGQDNDVLHARQGNDILFGGTGDDWLGAGQGADQLFGGDGDDMLRGRLGNDTVSGGAGADRFWFHSAGPSDADLIADFEPGTDAIELDALSLFTALASQRGAALDAGSFAAGTGISAQTASETVLYDTSSGALYYDADGSGSGAPLLIATLSGAPALAASDFFIV